MWTEHELGITNGNSGVGAAGRKVHVGVPPHPWPMTIPESATRAQIGALGEQLAVEHLTGSAWCWRATGGAGTANST